MDRETARQEIRRRIKCTDYLTKSKSGLYCCPFCGSGTGPHATGALKVYDTNTFTCHACNKSGDVIDLYQAQTGTDYNTALSLMADSIGITINQYSPEKNDPVERPTIALNDAGNTKPLLDAKSAQNATETPTDYTAYYRECMPRINDPAAVKYLEKRGISLDTARAYCIGYDPAADPAQSGHPCPRLIIPTSAGHYIGRRIDGEKEFAKLNPKGSTPAVFNAGALCAQDVREVFVTEGVFDALAIIEAGAAAIALNSTANATTLINRLEERKPAATLILCLDNDDAGKRATETLKEGLQRLNISFITANICAGYKDPNDALTGNKEAFIAALEQAQHQAGTRPDNTQYYIDAIMAGDIDRFKEEIKTGFNNIDTKANGLYAGLYTLAATSSLGKTFCAATGRPAG